MAGDTQSARDLLGYIDKLRVSATAVGAMPADLAGRVRKLHDDARRRGALAQVDDIPIARLRESAKGLRLEALDRAGFTTVGRVLSAQPAHLLAVPGVGEATARQVLAAARQVQASAEHSFRLRFDIKTRTSEHGELLDLLRRYDDAVHAVEDLRPGVTWFRAEIVPHIARATPAASAGLRRLFTRPSTKASADAAIGELEARVHAPAGAAFSSQIGESTAWLGRARCAEEIWRDFEQNAAQLMGILGELTDATSDAESTWGHLPAEIVERVGRQQLDLAYLKAGLRGYQAFGAKYALVQRRTILGDEMGLGKTVEALAVLCHLRAQGHDRAVVVCPASVVANWRNEVGRHTKLRAHVVHGADRENARRAWERAGGVAITTFDGLKRLPPPQAATLPVLVVDEAHYAKNPDAQRSQAVGAWARASERVMFLTGTPMENRVEEFQALVSVLQPQVAAKLEPGIGVAGPTAFQAAVAPVYLRRNQVDVLGELPERIESLAWVDPTTDDLAAYRYAVQQGNFMLMRRAAYLAAAVGTNPDGAGRVDRAAVARSAKLQRLLDIVEEARAEALKVVVFSYFRDVLGLAAAAANLARPGDVLGPLTGATPPNQRQALVDELTRTDGPGVLVAQIEAGGVGLNIHAASVVVLCEPQWKPSIENQAIARAHRMGQVRRVQVHRLVTPGGVDQHMLAIMAGKSRLFADYVLGSAIKDLAPDAVDISDLDAVDRVVSEAQAERIIIEAERRRLDIDDVAPTSTGKAT